MHHLGEHDYGLVAVSIAVAVLGSYAALDLAARVKASTGWTKGAWLAAAAVAMGGGIWSMHFVAMLAFRLPGIEVHFDMPLTIISLVLPISVTAFGFFVESRRGSSVMALGLSGVVMGVGIAVMHYTGMAALIVPASLDYDWFWVSVSVVIAIGAATAALALAFRDKRFSQRVFAAVAMGVAIAGMHYSAMLGAQFTPSDVPYANVGLGHVDATHLALWVTTTTFLVLALGLMAATYDRNLAAHAAREAAALRESDQRFRLLLQSVTDYAIFMLDTEGRIVNWNAGAERIKGYTSDDIIGQHISRFYPREEREAGAPDAALATAARSGKFEAEGWRIRKDGSRFWASVIIDPVRDEEGRLIGFAKVTRDVTERKRTQEALETAREALAQAQKMEAIGQLTGGMAHDFNNLLMAVLGSLELLRKRMPDDPRLLRLVDNALQGAQRGATLTQRMLSFARRQDLKPGAVDLPRLVHGMADLLQRSLGPAIKVETRFHLNLPLAEVDPHQLEIAVLNLAVNARDAMPEGGTVTIGAHAVGPDMTEQPMVCLYVAYTGEGMDPATLARAQEPFFTTKGVGKGTGLGLPMVQGLAEQSKGCFILKSETGKGTTAEIWLPLSGSAEKAAPVESIASLSRHSTRPLTVLVVDDDALVLENTASLLEDLGHRVIEARSGEEALHLMARARTLDLVVTDHAMPGMNGLQLAERIRQERADLRLILATGYADLAEGAASTIPKLHKPFDQATLARAIYTTMYEPAKSPNVIPLRSDDYYRRET